VIQPGTQAKHPLPIMSTGSLMQQLCIGLVIGVPSLHLQFLLPFTHSAAASKPTLPTAHEMPDRYANWLLFREQGRCEVN
tara:strand:+ start:332 stop:571 length:240 start_codon:yes stop_codon:yes gene_type:complete